MGDYILLALMLFIVMYLLYGYYSPKIEIVLLYKKHRVYLWYNKWDGHSCKRVHKKMFDI